jgi:tetratricopeptide (TPR) repeat protein
MARASGRLTEAIDLYEQIIDRFPDYALAYHELALAFRLSSQSVDAVNVMEQALQLTSPRVDFYLRAGAIYEYVQDDSMALEMFRCALQLDPDNDLAQEAIKRIRGD